MRFLHRLIPRNKDFFEPLAAIAGYAAENAMMLRDVLTDPPQAPKLLSGMHEHRKKLDEVAENVATLLSRAFMPPTDPEDISQLNAELHRLGDSIDDAARLFVAMNLGASRGSAVTLCSHLADGTTQLRDAAMDLKNVNAVRGAAARIRDIEHDADAVYERAISALFDGNPDPVTVVKWKDVYDRVENLIDMVHHTGNLVDRIVIKAV